MQHLDSLPGDPGSYFRRQRVPGKAPLWSPAPRWARGKRSSDTLEGVPHAGTRKRSKAHIRRLDRFPDDYPCQRMAHVVTAERYLGTVGWPSVQGFVLRGTDGRFISYHRTLERAKQAREARWYHQRPLPDRSGQLDRFDPRGHVATGGKVETVASVTRDILASLSPFDRDRLRKADLRSLTPTLRAVAHVARDLP